jgi:hypothetical protein
VHVLWKPSKLTPWAAEGGPEVDPTGIFYAVSTDGGDNFEERGRIATNGGIEHVAHPFDAAVAPDGSLIAVWSEFDEIPELGVLPHQTLRFTHSHDGREWSESATLLDAPVDTSQGYPAVAATVHGWHVLFYEANNEKTSVKVASASFDTLEFQTSHEVASRPFARQQFWLGDHANWGLDIVNIGDYTGLASAGSTIAAAFVLPEGDEWPARRRAYAWIAETSNPAVRMSRDEPVVTSARP